MSSSQTLGHRARQGSVVDEQVDDDSSSSWLMTYGDLISVLLTFFIMLQGISIVNEDEWAELFNKKHFFLISKEAFEGKKIVAKRKVAIEQDDYAVLTFLKQAQRRIHKLTENVSADFRAAGLRHMVTAKPSLDRMSVEVNINSSLLFRSGQGHMVESAKLIIDKLTNVLCKYDDVKIGIEGHTDNIPINTTAYPSNWELSSIRATSVLRRMVDNCIDPSQITATGFSDRIPVKKNSTAKDRAKNRRIMVRLEYSTATHLDIIQRRMKKKKSTRKK